MAFLDSLGSGLGSVAGGLLGDILGLGPDTPQGNFSINQSAGSSFGRSGSKQQSSSVSSATQFPDTIWGAQAPFLADLYGRAQQGLGQGNEASVTSLYNLGGAGVNDLLNPEANPMSDVYARQLQQQFENNVLPGIQRQSQGFGQYGGARQGIAEGLAADAFSRELGDFNAKLYSDDQNRKLGALGQIPGLGAMGLGIPWYGLQQYGGLLGAPTVLGGGGVSSSASQGTGSSFGIEGSESSSSGISSPERNDVFGPPAGGAAPPAFGGFGGRNGGGLQYPVEGYNPQGGNITGFSF